MLILHNAFYMHPDRSMLFNDINLSINKHDKIALTGNNGAGKSTLLHLLSGKLPLSAGVLKTDTTPYYVPQHFGQFNNLTVAQALNVADKLQALKEILEGKVSDTNFALLDDEWTIEERCAQALTHWNMDSKDLTRKMGTLSGGQKTKVFLAGISIHGPELILLDEPSNHMDMQSRDILYDYITTTTKTLVVVSHDRTLLNLLDVVYELNQRGITVYGGNYDFYVAQKSAERSALELDLQNKEKALRKARETERDAMEREQKRDAKGKKKQEKAGVPTIAMNTLRNNAEKSTSRMKAVHSGKIDAIADTLNRLRKDLPQTDKMKIGFDSSSLHTGKVLITAKDINAAYNNQPVWEKSLNFSVLSGERIAIKGSNGSGKTTLIKMMLGQLQPIIGKMISANIKAIYIDQDYSLIDNHLSVYEQAQIYNSGKLQDHEIKIRLRRFLFTKDDWDKSCVILSGGERMRLILCCLTIDANAPDMIVLDEPTNNLDIQNTELLTTAINEYRGTLIVVSHDAVFLKQAGVFRDINL